MGKKNFTKELLKVVKEKTKKELNTEIEKYKECISFYFGEECLEMSIDEIYEKLKKQKSLNKKICIICYLLTTLLLCLSCFLLGLGW